MTDGPQVLVTYNPSNCHAREHTVGTGTPWMGETPRRSGHQVGDKWQGGQLGLPWEELGQQGTAPGKSQERGQRLVHARWSQVSAQRSTEGDKGPKYQALFPQPVSHRRFPSRGLERSLTDKIQLQKGARQWALQKEGWKRKLGGQCDS